MKVYNKKEYESLPLYFWSNCVCDLHDPHNHVDELEADIELPTELKLINEGLYRESSAGRAYLTEMDGKYGITYECEYYETTEYGEPGEINNYAKALEVAAKAEKEFPFATVYVGKQCGNDWYSHEDPATLMCIFIDSRNLSIEALDHIEEWIFDNAWSDSEEAA